MLNETFWHRLEPRQNSGQEERSKSNSVAFASFKRHETSLHYHFAETGEWSALRRGSIMAWQHIQAGADVLGQFAKKKSIDAIAEMIWNSLDAEAETVNVEIESSHLGEDPNSAAHVVSVEVVDNGHGITPDLAHSTFTTLGNSWKKGLNGRSLNNLRPLHGQAGRGRFFAYSIGHLAKWTTVSQPSDSLTRRQIEISGDSDRIDGFEISESVETDSATGTTVKISVEQGRPNNALLSDHAHTELAAIFAPYLLYNDDLRIRFNGLSIDPRPFIVGEPKDMTFEGDAPEMFELLGQPVLTIVDWNDEMTSAPGVVLCTADGASLLELEKTSPPGNIRSTAYLRWNGWATTGADLLMVRAEHPEIVTWAIDTLRIHVSERSAAIQESIIDELKRADAYPYENEISDPVEVAERDMFDLVAVTARGALRSGNRRQISMTTKLMRLALQQRPEELDKILEEVLNLSDEERADLNQLLQHSSLGAIISAASEVTRRLDLIAALRHMMYDPELSEAFREIDQLHPLIRDNAWIFGETWQLTASEKSLRTVLRSVIGDDVVLEDDLEEFLGDAQEGDRRRIDLLLQRTQYGPEDFRHRLVVELKRPSVPLGVDESQQITSYATRLSAHQGAGRSKWTFVLIGSGIKDELKPQLNQLNRKKGHLLNGEDFDVFVTSWGDQLNECENRYRFYYEQLKSSATIDESVLRMRQRYSHLLPGAPIIE
ncbi:MAG: ATP-binding protein [Acidimicrobiales bacterium]